MKSILSTDKPSFTAESIRAMSPAMQEIARLLESEGHITIQPGEVRNV